MKVIVQGNYTVEQRTGNVMETRQIDGDMVTVGKFHRENELTDRAEMLKNFLHDED